MRPPRVTCFAAGLAAAYLLGAAAAVAGLWVWDAGRGRHPVAVVRHRMEDRHVT